MPRKNMSLPILRSAYPDLTKSEKKIADFIMAHVEDITNYTIAELAKNTDSSDITISRFCKKLGFTGLQGLKLALAAEPALHHENDRYTDIHLMDSYQEMAVKLFQNIEEGLQDTLKLLDFQEVSRAVDCLLGARIIYVYGVGNSATLCQDFETRFIRFGMMIHMFSDVHMQLTTAALLTEQDVVVAISHSGATHDIVDAVQIAKQNGAKIIAITSRAQSPLARIADIVLVGMGREVHYRSEATASRFVHMAIIDLLYTGVATKVPDTYHHNIEKMRQVIQERKK